MGLRGGRFHSTERALVQVDRLNLRLRAGLLAKTIILFSPLPAALLLLCSVLVLLRMSRRDGRVEEQNRIVQGQEKKEGRSPTMESFFDCRGWRRMETLRPLQPDSESLDKTGKDKKQGQRGCYFRLDRKRLIIKKRESRMNSLERNTGCLVCMQQKGRHPLL